MESNRLSLFELASRGLLKNFFGAEESDNSDDGGADDAGGEKDGGDKPNEDGGNPQAKIKFLAEEKDRHWNARTKAEQERDEAQAKLRQFEDAGKDEKELLTRDNQELKQQLEAANAELQKLRINNAFLTTNSVKWHNPERALSLVDLSEVEIGKDGTVDKKALASAIEALAKSDAYLVKQEQDQQDQNRDRQRNSSSGNPPGRQGSDKDKLDQAALAAKYPALRTRLGR